MKTKKILKLEFKEVPEDIDIFYQRNLVSIRDIDKKQEETIPIKRCRNGIKLSEKRKVSTEEIKMMHSRENQEHFFDSLKKEGFAFHDVNPINGDQIYIKETILHYDDETKRLIDDICHALSTDLRLKVDSLNHENEKLKHRLKITNKHMSKQLSAINSLEEQLLSQKTFLQRLKNLFWPSNN